jgi:sugar lactone lactonase YvrE
LVEIPTPTTPTEVGPAKQTNSRKSIKTLSEPLPKDQYDITRFNDGNADPYGRMFHGSMTMPDMKDGKKRGQFWRYDPDGKEVKILEAVGTSNGLGWSPNFKTMCKLA